MEQPKIQDYAIIGDGRSAALISNRGSIDWLCWPRFDSASIFAALLDRNVGGAWSIRPTEHAQTTRRYIDNTNVLETEFATASGTIVLTDFMPVTSEEEKKKKLWPEHELVRQVKCAQGQVELIVDFNPRLDYGRVAPKIKDCGKLGCRIDIGTCIFTFRSEIELVRRGDGLSASTTLKVGETIAYGAPLRLRVENQLGYKMVKWIERIEFVKTEKALAKGEGGKSEDEKYFDILPNI